MADFVKVAGADELPPGSAKCVVVGRKRIALYNVDGALYATDDTCTHATASLAEGYLDGHEIECPLHGARFDVRTGQALCLPAVKPVATYEVKAEDGAILVRL